MISQINVNNKLQVFGELAKHSFAQSALMTQGKGKTRDRAAPAPDSLRVSVPPHAMCETEPGNNRTEHTQIQKARRKQTKLHAITADTYSYIRTYVLA